MKDDLKSGFSRWSDVALSGFILLLALVLVVIAFTPGRHLLKVLTLAWVLLP